MVRRMISPGPAAQHWPRVLFVLLCLWSGPGAMAWTGGLPFSVEEELREQNPHLPTEQELQRRLGPPKHEDDRYYQRDSVAFFGHKSQRALRFIREKLSSIYLTPARFLAVLGLFGLFYTWNKNKGQTRWAVLYAFSILLLICGIAARVFRWPYMN